LSKPIAAACVYARGVLPWLAAMSDDSAPSSCRWADVSGGYATGSEASTDDRLVPYDSSYDTQTIDTIATGASMISEPIHSVTSPMTIDKALWTVGSDAHQAGRCKPCAFYHKQGCQNGSDCIFCHQCPPHEKQRRKRLRRRMLREHFAPAHGQGHDTELRKCTEDSQWTYGQNYQPMVMTTKPSNGEQWRRGNRSWAAQDTPLAADGGGTQARQFAPQEPGMVLAACPSPTSSLLSTAPRTLPPGACRFVQEESPYSSPTHNMGYQPGPVQYALVQVPVPMQQLPHPSQQQQANGAVGVAMACPPWNMDPGSPCIYGDGYGDVSNMQWGNAAGAPYMCVVSPHSNGSGCGERGLIQVPAF